jgi:hypothetical protein
LDDQMRDVLVQLELCSHGTTAALGLRGDGQGIYPPGERFPPHLAFRRRYERCWTHAGRERVLKDAREELERCRHAPKPSPVSFKQRILTEWEGHHYTEVAKVTNTPALTVYRWRRDAGLVPLTGLPQ